MAKIKLGFDPTNPTNPIIKEVFENRVARNVWIGFKRGHLTSQFFNEDCLKIAKAVETENPETATELVKLFSRVGTDGVFKWTQWNEESQLKTVAGLMPYVIGDQDFEYEELS